MISLHEPILFIFISACSLCAAQESHTEEVKLRDGGAARITPRIEAGYVDVQLFGSDGEPAGKPLSLLLSNQVAPELRVEVRTSPAEFRYKYELRNGVSGRQRINNWDLVLPKKDAVEGAEQPKQWHSATIVSGVSQVRHGLDGAATGAIFSWYRMLDSAPFIGPGETLSGFVLHSAYAPGIVYSYSFGDMSDNTVLGDLPSEVTMALLPYLQGEVQSQPRMTVGPFFPPGTSKAVILKSYLGKLEAAREPFLGGARESFLSPLLALLAKASNASPEASKAPEFDELCKFCNSSQRIATEEAIRQGIRTAVCTNIP